MAEIERIAAFWRWWAEHAGWVAEAIEAGDAGDIGSEISPQIDA